jgi:GNAT superfamily N-acetyltransferase
MLQRSTRVDDRTAFERFPFDRGFLTHALADLAGAAIYADRPSEPRAALLAAGWSRVSFVWGDPGARDAGSLVVDAARGHRPGRMVILSVPDAAWRDAIMAGAGPGAFVVPRVDYDAFDRQGFERGAAHRTAGALPVVPIDGELIDRVRPECDEHFDPAAFRERGGIGFVALDANREHVRAVAWTATVGGQSNIGVATRPEHRRQGLANAVGRAVVERCLAAGVRLHVCTGATNSAARALGHTAWGFASRSSTIGYSCRHRTTD